MTLSGILRASRERIVERWRTHAQREVAGESMTRSELIDTLPLFLDELAAALDRGSEKTAVDLAATSHGAQRMHLGFAEHEVVREYNIVRDSVLDECLACGYEPHRREIWEFCRLLTESVGISLTAFMREREHERDRVTSEHIAFLAHELRNPLHAARMALSLHARGQGDPQRLLRLVERSISSAIRGLDNELTGLRLQGPALAKLEALDAARLIADAREDAIAVAESAGRSIRSESDPGLRVLADARLLASALGNLVMNAAKFTRPGGTITLRARKVDARIRFEVEDECGGLPLETMDKLFDPFVQGGRDRTGFGLGLAIARQATEAHGGTLTVHNLPGKGCIFLLELPAPP
jgi:signal transduction histidine kinase